MKRIALAGGLALAYALTLAYFTYAAIATNTPIVPPNETGENSSMQQQVVDMARFKPGFTTATAGGTVTAATVTANTAAGSITWPGTLAIVSNATATLVITDSKVQAGDAADCVLDLNGAAAGSLPTVNGVIVTPGSLTCVLTNSTVTSPGYTPKIYFLIWTVGNPN
jgi:hypothetical protein